MVRENCEVVIKTFPSSLSPGSPTLSLFKGLKERTPEPKPITHPADCQRKFWWVSSSLLYNSGVTSKLMGGHPVQWDPLKTCFVPPPPGTVNSYPQVWLERGRGPDLRQRELRIVCWKVSKKHFFTLKKIHGKKESFLLLDNVQNHMSGILATTSRSWGQRSTGQDQHAKDGRAERGKELESSHVTELLN